VGGAGTSPLPVRGSSATINCDRSGTKRPRHLSTSRPNPRTQTTNGFCWCRSGVLLCWAVVWFGCSVVVWRGGLMVALGFRWLLSLMKGAGLVVSLRVVARYTGFPQGVLDDYLRCWARDKIVPPSASREPLRDLYHSKRRCAKVHVRDLDPASGTILCALTSPAGRWPRTKKKPVFHMKHRLT